MSNFHADVPKSNPLCSTSSTVHVLPKANNLLRAQA